GIPSTGRYGKVSCYQGTNIGTFSDVSDVRLFPATEKTGAVVHYEDLSMIRPSAPARQRLGIAAVEMAVLLIPLMTLFLGVIEFGRIIQVSQVVTEAAREGARAAAQGVSVQTVGSFIYYYASASSPNAPNSAGTTRVNVADVVNQYLVCAGITNVTGVNT